MTTQDSPLKLSDYRDASGRQSRRRQLHKPGDMFRERYRIVKVLASGGFGVTYLVQDGGIPGSPLCVIKQLCPKVSNPMALERAKRRFRKEAKVLAKVGSHSQIPRLLDYFTINDGFYLVQEYIPGQVLTREVRRSGPYGEREVKQFLREILPVLKFIHRCRIIHRDIKPPNIIRCADDGRLVLIDFGAVRECLGDLGDGNSYQIPITQFVGTPGFAPPEQQALRPTYASDIYALGMTCLFLLTTKTPVEFDSDPKTGAILWEHLVDASRHFSGVLNKMLCPDVVDRYESVEEVMRALLLEEHLDALTPGLSHQPRVEPSPVEDELELAANGYLTPIQRQAIAIRRWRSRQHKLNPQPFPNTGFSMNTSSASPRHNF